MVKLTALASKQNSSLTKSLRNANLSAGALLTALLGVSQLSYANLPLGNTAGTNNIAIGQNSFASGTGSQAVGTGAIATGGNITPEQFGDELVKFRAILAQIEQTRTQIAQHERDSTVNQNLQEALNRQIAEYEAILERVREKQEKQAVLNEQKSAKQEELTKANTQLTELQTQFGSNALLPTGNKESYKNFLNIINALNWEKLDTPTGIADLTTDLKNGVEKDFGPLNISDEKYKELIEGYRNAQGNITYLTPQFNEKIYNDFGVSGLTYANLNSINGFDNSHTNYAANPGTLIKENLKNFVFKSDIEEKLLSSENLISIIANTAFRHEVFMLENKIIDPDRQKERNEINKENYIYNLAYQVQKNAAKQLYAQQDGAFYKLLQNYDSNVIDRYQNSLRDLQPSNSRGGAYSVISPFTLPVIKNKVDDNNFTNLYDTYEIVSSHIIDSSQSINESVITELKQNISKFKAFKENIDFNNNDSWLFDKEEYRAFLNNVDSYVNKLKTLTEKYDALKASSISDNTTNEIQKDIILLRQEISSLHSKPESYLFNFRPTKWNSELITAIDEAKNLWFQYEAEAKEKLLPYRNNEVTERVAAEVDAKAKEIKTQQEGINTKQAEIADLETQINALALTGEEQSAEKVKLDLTKKLDEAKAALTTLNQTLREKRDALLALDTELTNSPLGKKGDNAIAEGTNAFASGANAIAVGSESRAIGDQSIAIGHQAKALKDKALAIGNNAVANAEAAIAIGDNAGVSGQNAVGIGANSLVTGKNAVSVGANNIVAHDNAVAIGANITKTAANSVNLGNESEATVERTEQTAGTTNYAYADILGSVYQFAAAEPVGVVTVGGKGKERRVQNVAAGLVSRTSTDAVNGSQLFALAEAVDQGAIGLVRQHPTNGVIGIANHRLGNEVNIANAAGEARRLSGVAEAVAPTDAVNKGQFDREIGGLNNRVSGVEKQVNRIKGAVSNAVAMASMPQATNAGQRMVSVGTGHTHGITAVSVGLSGLSDNGKVSFKVNTSVSQKSDFAVGAGLGFAW